MNLPEVIGIASGASRPGNTAAPCEVRDASLPGEADGGLAVLDPQPASTAGPGAALPLPLFAIMRVCMYCNRVMGAKEMRDNGKGGAEIPLHALSRYRMDLGAHAVTGGICQQCLESNAMMRWRAPDAA